MDAQVQRWSRDKGEKPRFPLDGEGKKDEKGRTRKMAMCGSPVGPHRAIASLVISPTLPGLERERVLEGRVRVSRLGDT